MSMRALSDSAATMAQPARDRVPYQMDGEPLGEAGELQFRWEPDSLRLVRPARPPG